MRWPEVLINFKLEFEVETNCRRDCTGRGNVKLNFKVYVELIGLSHGTGSWLDP